MGGRRDSKLHAGVGEAKVRCGCGGRRCGGKARRVMVRAQRRARGAAHNDGAGASTAPMAQKSRPAFPPTNAIAPAVPWSNVRRPSFTMRLSLVKRSPGATTAEAQEQGNVWHPSPRTPRVINRNN